MDPYIEDQEWEDFHTTFNTVMRESLTPPLEPRYIVRVERRVYVEHPLGGEDDVRWADVAPSCPVVCGVALAARVRRR
jgi:hypothetical protein